MSSHHISEKQVKTRKPHLCFLCGKDIPEGETCLTRTASIDGKIVTDHMHLLCDKATWDWDAMDWETFGFGDLPPEALEGITL